MRIVEDVRSFDEVLPPVVLTIGSFDGIHLGHQEIIARVIVAARAAKGTAALMTLRPHPREFFSPKHAPNILTGPRQKERLLASLGIDVLFVLPFNADVANLDRARFLDEIVLGRCGARRLVIGHDFNFGKGAEGDFEFLAGAAPGRGFEVEQIPALVLRGERVSSTLIRERILQGDLEEAEYFLGRKYAIEGVVQRGRGMGRKLGFPTANIAPGNCTIPPHGVYAAEACIDGEKLAAAVNIGIAPTIRHEDVMVEAYILDFDGDLVEKPMELIFHKRLRPEKKYPSIDLLIEAIAEDVREVRRFFAAGGVQGVSR